jgi:hypothetical protein
VLLASQETSIAGEDSEIRSKQEIERRVIDQE